MTWNISGNNPRILEEGDPLVGKPCVRNGCGLFKIGDRVYPLSVNNPHLNGKGTPRTINCGLHAEHHEEAMAVIADLVTERTQMIVYHAVVQSPIAGCICDDDPVIDEDTIGIYSSPENADYGVARYRASRREEIAETDPELVEGGNEQIVIRPVQIDTDLIYPEPLGPDFVPSNNRNK